MTTDKSFVEILFKRGENDRGYFGNLNKIRFLLNEYHTFLFK